jgi:hypothetical protein
MILYTLALGAAILTLAGAPNVRAEAEPEGGAFASAPATVVGSNFGLSGQFVLSVGATTGEHALYHKEGGNWQLQFSPALDYFVASRVSVGAVVGYRHATGGTGTGTNGAGSDTFTLGGRVGFNINFNERVGLWSRAGFSLDRVDANHASTTNTWFTFYAPVLFHLAPHFFAGLGPSFQYNLSGPAPNEYGVDSMIGGWF